MSLGIFFPSLNSYLIDSGSMCCQQMEDIQSSSRDRKSLDIPLGIGEDTRIMKAIVDKNARIGRNVLVRKVQKN